MKTFFNYIFHKIERRIAIAFTVFFGLSIYFVLFYKRQNPGVTPLMVIRGVEQIRDGEWPHVKYRRVPISELQPYTIYGFMAAEDQKFLEHFGFDVDAIFNAIDYNIKHKTIAIGGSTISQQTAKNLFLRPGRDFVRKIVEGYFTLLMEITWSKERILETYLNIIEFGDGIYGIEGASRYYFDKPASKLTRSETLILTSILPNPRYYQNHLRSYVLSKRKSNISSGVSRLKRDPDYKEFINNLMKNE